MERQMKIIFFLLLFSSAFCQNTLENPCNIGSTIMKKLNSADGIARRDIIRNRFYDLDIPGYDKIGFFLFRKKYKCTELKNGSYKNTFLFISEFVQNHDHKIVSKVSNIDTVSLYLKKMDKKYFVINYDGSIFLYDLEAYLLENIDNENPIDLKKMIDIYFIQFPLSKDEVRELTKEQRNDLIQRIWAYNRVKYGKTGKFEIYKKFLNISLKSSSFKTSLSDLDKSNLELLNNLR
jgi:hypothetical protein